MTLFKNFFRKAAVTFAKVFSFAPVWARYAFTTISTDKLISEGYKKNSAVSACATTLQLTFPEPPLLVGIEDEGRFVPDYIHSLNALLKKPNSDMGMAEFLQFAVAYNSIGGNAYFWKQRNSSGRVIALYPFSDVNVTPIAGINTDEGFVAYYEFDPGNGRKVPISKDDIIHWKWMVDPHNPHKGIGAIELSAREVDRDNEATSYIFSLLKNNAVPPVVITLEPGDEPTQDEMDAMGQKWVQKHGAGQPAFITNGMKVDQLGYDLNKLAGETLADVPETRIAANFHVPPSVAGLNVGVKRSDYGDTAARKAFTEQTLMALWRSFASEMFNGLKDDFALPKNYALKFDVSNVGALQELKKDQRTSVNEMWKSGLVTRAEAKRELGMKPLAGDDVYYVSLATEFVPANSGAVVRDVVKGQKSKVEEKGSGGAALRRIRASVAARMKQAVDVYFSQLADRVVARAQGQKAEGSGQKTEGGELKADLPNANQLITAEDRKQLESLVKRFYIEITELSWDTWNVTLGVEKAFDLTDPVVTEVLKTAGTRVKEINDTTLSAIRDALKYGNDHGWSIDDLVRGDESQPGLRDIVDETYKDRARNIARTELGEAQNLATVKRYGEASVELVEILDNGSDDDDDECKIANGQIWTLKYFAAHSLEHPSCTRAAAPYFGDAKPDRG
jgi:HK97 family phage portal protein